MERKLETIQCIVRMLVPTQVCYMAAVRWDEAVPKLETNRHDTLL